MSHYQEKGRLLAVVGPTNTGKTHNAVERMLAYASGMIGFPLRLLAREVYDKVVTLKGQSRVALITGEEKIIPPNPSYFICTTESMPVSRPVEFLAIDEIQMATDWQRGHVFTNRLLSARGMHETMFMGSDTMVGLLTRLIPGIEIIRRPRFSELRYVAPKKISRLPRRSAIVAFNAAEVYGIAELIRRQKGGAAIVMGSLSPRTRNAQVQLYQDGEVDYLVATDAIGMGLNMDIDHVTFADTRKFDGVKFRDLTAAEMAQIAGRAGRHMNDGTFSTLAGEQDIIDSQSVDQIENHTFTPIKHIMWRNAALNYNSPLLLLKSLEQKPKQDGLVRAPEAIDLIALKKLIKKPEVLDLANTPARIRLLWDVCQIPDFRKLSESDHFDRLTRLYGFLASKKAKIPHEYMAKQVSRLDNCHGDIDTLAARIASTRVWTYISHRQDWLEDASHWAHITRGIEDKLSDALHEKLTQRFIDRRTSLLMRELRKKGDLLVSIEQENGVYVEDQYLGQIEGFSFFPDKGAARDDHKSLKAAAERALRKEVSSRVEAFQTVEDKDILLDTSDNLAQPKIMWNGAQIAFMQKGETAFKPRIKLVASNLCTSEEGQLVVDRLDKWFAAQLDKELGPLFKLDQELAGNLTLEEGQVPLTGMARGIAYQLLEHFGVLPRHLVDQDLRQVELEERKGLHRYRIRLGAGNLFIPILLKPAATRLRLLMWALWNDQEKLPDIPTPGMVWTDMDRSVPHDFYRVAGFRPAGKKAVRVDMMERLADAVRPLGTNSKWFETTPEIMGLVGLSGEDFANVMRAIGYNFDKRKLTAAEVAEAKAKREAEEAAAKAAAEAEAAKDAEKTTEGSDNKDAAATTDEAQVAPETPETPETPEAAEATEAAKENVAETVVVTVAEPAEKPASTETTAPTDSGEEELVEVYFFRWGGRKPAGGKRPHLNNTDQGNKRPQGKPQGKGGKPYGKKPGQGRKGHGKSHKPRSNEIYSDKKSAAPEDSPFAALAGLKDQMTKK